MLNRANSDTLVSHVDFYASCAAMVEQGLEEDEAPDSLMVLDALLGRSESGRDELILEGVQGKTVLRQNEWVFIPPHDGSAVDTNTNIELGNSPEAQLYDLADDIGQIRNVATEHTDILSRMSARVEEILASKRTRPL